MKTFSTDGRLPLGVVLADDGDPATAPSPHPADIQCADQDAAIAVYPQPRTVTLPGRDAVDLEAISDLWLD